MAGEPSIGLAAAIAGRAAADPESPSVFWLDGWDWRWWSHARVAALAGRWRAALAALPAGARVGFDGAAYPHALVLDLAALGAGLEPVPTAARATATPETATLERTAASQAGDGGERVDGGGEPACAAWLEVVPAAPAGRSRRRLGDEWELRLREPVPGARQPEGAAAPGAGMDGGLSGPGVPGVEGGREKVEADGGRGAVWVRGPAGWRRVTEAAVTAAAARTAALAAAGGEAPAVMAAGRGQGRRRPIVVAGQPLGSVEGRVVTAWALLAGAALVLDPHPARRRASAVWARPTVFVGDAEEMAWLRRQAEAARRPRRWLPWGRASLAATPPLARLRTLLASDAPAAADVAFWRDRGVNLAQVPGLGPA